MEYNFSKGKKVRRRREVRDVCVKRKNQIKWLLVIRRFNLKDENVYLGSLQFSTETMRLNLFLCIFILKYR